MYTGDVERVLTAHPSIAEAGVVQIDSEERGEVVVAVVVLSRGSEATDQNILAFAGMHLAPHQVPQYVVFVDRLRGTRSGS